MYKLIVLYSIFQHHHRYCQGTYCFSVLMIYSLAAKDLSQDVKVSLRLFFFLPKISVSVADENHLVPG